MSNNTLTLYSMTGCGHCIIAKNYLQAVNIPFNEVNVSEVPAAREFLIGRGHTGVPQVYSGDRLFVEHYSELQRMGPQKITERLETF